MRRGRLKHWLLALFCCASCTPAPKAPTEIKSWAVYYDSKLPAEDFASFDVVVFDRRYHPPLKPLKHKVTLLAYVSAGEMHGDSPRVAELRKEGAVLADNKQWKSHVMDLTSARWRSVVMDEVDDALKQGFDGVMLDTLDSTLDVAQKQDPKLGAATEAAAVQLIRDIRARHPHIRLMLNRGLKLLPDVSGQLDFILAESILAETNVSSGQSKLFPPNTYRQVAGLLQDAQVRSPQLKIVTLDYWDPDDVQGIRQLYAIQRAHGFVPYVATPDLRRLILEPHSRHPDHEKTPPIATGYEE